MCCYSFIHQSLDHSGTLLIVRLCLLGLCTFTAYRNRIFPSLIKGSRVPLGKHLGVKSKQARTPSSASSDSSLPYSPFQRERCLGDGASGSGRQNDSIGLYSKDEANEFAQIVAGTIVSIRRFIFVQT